MKTYHQIHLKKAIAWSLIHSQTVGRNIGGAKVQRAAKVALDKYTGEIIFPYYMYGKG